ncbi:MAG: NnrU family protein [Halocynthiibacter sp.]
MTLLITGLILWIAAHFFKRLAPGLRAPMGMAGKGVVAVVLLLSVVLMVKGFRSAGSEEVYAPLAGMGPVNNTLMLIAVFLAGAAKGKGIVAARLRHPMLWGAVVWAIAHLLVNGDQASLVLFGGIGLWALAQMALINRAEGAWQRPAMGPISGDAKIAVATLVLYGLIGWIHIWLGYNPFSGTYS